MCAVRASRLRYVLSAARSDTGYPSVYFPGELPRIAQCTRADHGSAGIPPFRSDPLLSKPCGILRDLLREAHPRTDQRCSRKLFSLRVMQKPT